MREGVDATRADRETGLSVGGREALDGGREDGGEGLDVLAEEAGGASEAVMMVFVVSSGLLLFPSFFPSVRFVPSIFAILSSMSCPSSVLLFSFSFLSIILLCFSALFHHLLLLFLLDIANSNSSQF